MSRKTLIKLNSSNNEVQTAIVNYIVKAFNPDYDGCNGHKVFGYDFRPHSEFCYASDDTYFYQYGESPCWRHCPHSVSSKTALTKLIALIEPYQLAELNEVIQIVNKEDDPIQELYEIIDTLHKTVEQRKLKASAVPIMKTSIYLSSYRSCSTLSKLKLSLINKISPNAKKPLRDYYQITAIVSDDGSIDRKVDFTLRTTTWENHFIDLVSKMNLDGFSFVDWCTEHHKNIYLKCPAFLYPDLNSKYDEAELNDSDNDKMGELWYNWYEEFQDWDEIVQTMFINPIGEKIQNKGMRDGVKISFDYCKYIRSISVRKLDSDDFVWNVDL